MTCGIYTITNLETNQIYVGQSRIVEQRWAQHRDKPAKKVKQLLTNVEDPKNIEYGILKEIPDYHLFDKDLISFLLSIYEKFFINQYKESPNYECVNKGTVVIPPAPLTILSYPYDEDLFKYIEPLHLINCMISYLDCNEIDLIDVMGDRADQAKRLDKKYAQTLEDKDSEIRKLNNEIKNRENIIGELTRYKVAFSDIKNRINSFI